MTRREPSVLLVCQDAVLRAAAVRRFEAEGWQTQEALHQEDAERRAVRFRPHIVLLDARVVDDVEETLRRWKTLPTLLKSRIIVLAEHPSAAQVHAILSAGAETIILIGHQSSQDIVRIAGNLLP